ncbi:MAG: BlaI/MecI/CopY family transcriptional regulator [Oscillospiraceae bacterium]|nr:BlaI/MecI/CopY family transcriptional regulator [Oscillospiraceae bacterium]MDD7429870.1 BlaI/MecI/CopY family transcriptional regulator [Oscillospiraceae bacterium]MDY2846956.1 BlaI/MecI/CopY family transcriptional regulator [Oscillospiraceae bacterium]
MCISDSEQSLMEMIWEREPLRSGELVTLAGERLGWKKSTVYTVVKKLTVKGFIRSENAVITALRSRRDVVGEKTESFVDKSCGGSLPMFLAAFLGKEKLTREEAEELKRLIDDHTEE